MKFYLLKKKKVLDFVRVIIETKRNRDGVMMEQVIYFTNRDGYTNP